MTYKNLEQQLKDSNNIFGTILRMFDDLVFVYDAEGRFIYFQAPSQDHLYLSPDMFIGKRPEDVMPLAAARKFTTEFEKCRMGAVTSFEYSMPGETKALQFYARLVPLLENGEFIGAVSIAKDITAESYAEEQLKVSEIVYRSTSEGIIMANARGDILSVNPAFTAITGYTEEDVVGKNPRILKSDRHPAEFYAEMWHSLLKEGFWRGEVWNRRKNGETYLEILTINSIRAENGEIKYFLSVFNEITDQKQWEERILHQAYHDPLTDLPNRNLLHDRVKVALRHAHRANKKVSVVFMDLDHFKEVNDTQGHIVGDYLLQEIAKRMRECIREEDTLARIGGDEFVFLLADVESETRLIQFANRVLGVFTEPFRIGDYTCSITASLGLSVFPGDGTKEDDLLNKADMAMYYAKRNGRNNFQFFSSEMNDKINQRVEMEQRLKKALEKEEMVVYYQSIYQGSERKLVGCEATLRWYLDDSVLLPAEFFPLAEENGALPAIEAWFLKEAIAALGQLRKRKNAPPTMTIAVPASQFMRRDFCRFIKDMLREHFVSAESLVLGITEQTIMENLPSIASVIGQLQKMGIAIAIDGFGTGFFSLNCLKAFSADYFRIDRSFVAGLPEDERDLSIVRAMIGLADSLGVSIVGVGVEKQSQFEQLLEIGCETVQGDYFSEPLAEEAFLEILG